MLGNIIFAARQETRLIFGKRARAKIPHKQEAPPSWATAGGYGWSPTGGRWVLVQVSSFPAVSISAGGPAQAAASLLLVLLPSRKYLHPVPVSGDSSAASRDSSVSHG